MNITVDLAHLGTLAAELDEYEKHLKRKTDELRKRAGEELGKIARRGFATATADTELGGADTPANVRVDVTEEGNVTVVTAFGEDAVWAEFGAGVWFNGNAGGSPHPAGEKLGMTIGGYGKGNGKKEVWAYVRDGELHLTHGTPASMPMWNACQTVAAMMNSIAEELFRT